MRQPLVHQWILLSGSHVLGWLQHWMLQRRRVPCLCDVHVPGRDWGLPLLATRMALEPWVASCVLLGLGRASSRLSTANVWKITRKGAEAIAGGAIVCGGRTPPNCRPQLSWPRIPDYRAGPFSMIVYNHIVPHSRGGKTELSNGRYASRSCNIARGTRDDFDPATECCRIAGSGSEPSSS